jgi:hypothetical protein
MKTDETEALRVQVTVGRNGHIDVPPVELPEGTEAELVLWVRTAKPAQDPHSIMNLFGCLKGTYGTAEEIDAYINPERDSWD